MNDDAAADALRALAREALRSVIDPEIGLDVVELGLVYGIEVDGTTLRVDLTMTSAACPLGDVIVADAEQRLRALEGVSDVSVRLVWDPPWTPDRMSSRARGILGWET